MRTETPVAEVLQSRGTPCCRMIAISLSTRMQLVSERRRVGVVNRGEAKGKSNSLATWWTVSHSLAHDLAVLVSVPVTLSRQ